MHIIDELSSYPELSQAIAPTKTADQLALETTAKIHKLRRLIEMQAKHASVDGYSALDGSIKGKIDKLCLTVISSLDADKSIDKVTLRRMLEKTGNLKVARACLAVHLKAYLGVN